MCYSAQIKADYLSFVRHWGGVMSMREFVDVFWHRRNDAKVKIPKAMEALFADPTTDDERKVKAAIDEFTAAEATRLEHELFKQRKRLADAERTLATKATKAAAESRRIATDKVEWCQSKLAALLRTEHLQRTPRQPRRLLERPVRAHARHHDRQTFLRERAARRQERRSRIQPTHRRGHAGRVPVGSRWTAPGAPDLLSFAAITDDPPAEVAAAGHERCIMPIKPEHVDAWLSPDPKNLQALYAILDDRERPYYEHRLAA